MGKIKIKLIAREWISLICAVGFTMIYINKNRVEELRNLDTGHFIIVSIIVAAFYLGIYVASNLVLRFDNVLNEDLLQSERIK